MALASQDAEPMPDFRIRHPANTELTSNLIGRTSLIEKRRPEIRQRLAGYAITVN